MIKTRKEKSTPAAAPEETVFLQEAVEGGEEKRAARGLGHAIRSGIGAVLPQSRPVEQDIYAVEESKPKSGWLSPTYSLSRAVTLDPARLAANRCVVQREPDSAEVDAYRLLRTRILQRCKETGGNTIMITSALPGEGKTLTAINLAMILARELARTALLVDCDLRSQSVHHALGYQSDRGIIDYLLNDVPIGELITWPGIEKLTVISGGRPFVGSTELLGSQRMKELVADMKSRYQDRFVIFDVPPLLVGADALAFVPLVDHVVVTVSEAETSMRDVKRALQMVPREKVLGLVLNKHRATAKYPQNQGKRPAAR